VNMWWQVVTFAQFQPVFVVAESLLCRHERII
jgi:hypothetical protein